MTRTREQIEDELLVLRVQAGERAAMDCLVRRWEGRLRRFAAHKLGDSDGSADVVQDAWLAIARGMRRLDDPAAFGPWARRIVANKCADSIRRRARDRAAIRSVEPTEEAVETPPAGSDLDALRRAIRFLPEDARAILYLHYSQGLGVRAIARLLDIPSGTVKSRLHYTRSELRRTIERSER